jgi:uncharacterized protein YfdQ (DUF2303 family)
MKPNPSPNPPNPPDAYVPNNISTLLAAGGALGEIHQVDVHAEKGVPVALVPEGYSLEVLDLAALEHFAGKPNRKTGTHYFADTDSFCRYFKEHRSVDSRIFATIRDNCANFRAILNFHGDEPSFNDHVCELSLRPTHDWNVWINNSGQSMTQGTLATFLETNSDFFVSPSGADLLELISNLEGKAHVDITQAIKLQNGSINVKYTETVELRGGSAQQPGEIVMPKEFTVALEIFEGTGILQMKARLRYRIADKKIVFWYEPIHPEKFVREICAQVMQEIETETGIVPFRV